MSALLYRVLLRLRCCFCRSQDLELSAPDRLEKYSGKLLELGKAVGRLAAAGKKVQ